MRSNGSSREAGVPASFLARCLRGSIAPSWLRSACACCQLSGCPVDRRGAGGRLAPKVSSLVARRCDSRRCQSVGASLLLLRLLSLLLVPWLLSLLLLSLLLPLLLRLAPTCAALG